MPASAPCPSLERWQSLLAADLAPDEEERCERHLRSCPACRELLDRAREHGDALLGVARQVGDPTGTPPDPALTQLLGRWHAERPRRHPTPLEPDDLYFLRPSGQAGALGCLGDYEVRQVIGQGGMGVVLLAFDPALKRLVAIKVLSPDLAGSATARRRFTREARAAAAVCHDHVVAIHGVYEADGLPYLVMQYVAGESLQARLDRTGPLEVEEVVRIGYQSAAGLAAAHAQGLIHRDIKPANLLLEDGVARVKVTDFGLARMADDVGLKRAGVVAGTPEYMAPEQARGEAVDHRADLYGLGAVLYACCTGQPPFRGPTALAVLRRVSDEAPVPLRSLNPSVPAWLEGVIARVLAKDPAQRFPSAAEVAALLEGYLAHLRQSGTVPAPELPRAPGQREPLPRRPAGWRGRWSSLVAALVLLSVLGLSLYALRQGAPPTDRAGQPGPPAPAGAPAQPAEYPEEFHPELKGNAGGVPGLLVHGPDAPDCVKFEPEGLRITLPSTFPRQRPGTGVVTGFGVRGDFEITVGFEILGWPRPGAGGNPTELQLVIVPNKAPQPGKWQKATQNYASLSRRAPRGNTVSAVRTMPPRRTDPIAQAIASQVGAPSGTGAPVWPQALVALRVATLRAFAETMPPGDEAQKVVRETRWNDSGAFIADFTRWNNENVPRDEWGNEMYNTLEEHHPSPLFPAAASTGRLRLVRKGPTLSFFTSEPPAGDFKLLDTRPFGTDDLKDVRVLGSTGGPGASFDVRVTDLSIRAEGLPKMPAAAARPAAGGRKWPPGLLVLAGLVAAAVAVSLGTWYYTRTRRRPVPACPAPASVPAAAPPSPVAGGIVFKCPGCGKRLRARAEQAGSRPKCPQCGQEVVVPSVLPKKPEEQP
jgi:serine/threonine protein kinase/DNA-directed RNA polymerase subunit RPC12/RpoP